MTMQPKYESLRMMQPQKYQAMRALVAIHRGLGAVTLVAGGIIIIATLGHAGDWPWPFGVPLLMVPGTAVITTVLTLAFFASAELFQVLVDIEENQRLAMAQMEMPHAA